MIEDPGYIRDVSLHLSRALDKLGLNTRTVKRRRDLYLHREHYVSIFSRLHGNTKSSFYHFGSQTEGATTPGLRSDVDTLILMDGFNVIEDWTDWERGNINLLMLQEDTAPGYCRLQRLRSDIPTALHDLPDEDHTYDNSGRVILKNTWIQSMQFPGLQTVRNGLARSQCDMPGVNDRDFVLAFGCFSWPEQAHPFTRRQRRYDWPTQSLIREAIQRGVFFVPVGYKLSPTEQLEWRISASLAERCLMFSLSIVHIKCYVVLKMLMKTFVEPRIGKCISSYHCKTALLYCTENTESGFWREDNLLQCVTQCLVTLLIWVNEGFCPHFIISEENLFAGKVTAHNRGALQTVLTELIKYCGHKLLYVQIDDLGVQLQRKLNTNPSIMPVLDSLATVKLLAQFDWESHTLTSTCMDLAELLLQSTNSSIAVLYVNHAVGMLQAHPRQSNKNERRTVQAFIVYFYHLLGSLLASISLSRNVRVPRIAIQLLYFRAKLNVNSMLKLASVFYCNADNREAVSILHTIELYYGRHEIQAVCRCYNKRYSLSLSFCRESFAIKNRRKRSARFAHCVTFSPHEIHCAPPALRSELFRSVGDDMHHRNPLYDKWMCLACVDCRPYLYYLQYMTYKQLGQRDLQTRALHNFEKCIIEDDNYSHLETSWNLLGQCLESEQQLEAAMDCYKKSLEIRPRNNAANWHVAILCFRLIRDGYLPSVCQM